MTLLLGSAITNLSINLIGVVFFRQAVADMPILVAPKLAY
jgi:hypothetical protein